MAIRGPAAMAMPWVCLCVGCNVLTGIDGYEQGTQVDGTSLGDGTSDVIIETDGTPDTPVTPLDTSEETADVFDAGCTKNPCGGCTKLIANPGDKCCGGVFTCDGLDALACSGPGANKCGGCGALANEPGTPCPGGKCGTAAYQCKGTDDTTCVDPVSTPAPGSACGTCGSLKYACSKDGKSTVCPVPDDANACGGCGTLSSAPGTSCSVCGTSKWTCTVDKTAVTCPTPDDRTAGKVLDWIVMPDNEQILNISLPRAVSGTVPFDAATVSSVSFVMRTVSADLKGYTVSVEARKGTPSTDGGLIQLSGSVPVSTIGSGYPTVTFTFSPPAPAPPKGASVWFKVVSTAATGDTILRLASNKVSTIPPPPTLKSYSWSGTAFVLESFNYPLSVSLRYCP